jgi:hypothetical protein
MADFSGDDLTGSRFERVDLSGSEFLAVNLSGSRFRGVALSGSVLRGVELGNVDINGEIENVTINGVDIGPLIDAELNKRYPDRVKMRPADPAGFREAWDTVERLWDQTIARARRLPLLSRTRWDSFAPCTIGRRRTMASKSMRWRTVSSSTSRSGTGSTT